MTSKLLWISWCLANDDGSIPHLMGEFDGILSAKTLCGRTPGPDPVECSDYEIRDEEWRCNRCEKKFDKWLVETFQ